MSSKNIWSVISVEGIDSSDEGSPSSNIPDATQAQQATATSALDSSEGDIDDGTFTAVPARSRLSPEQRSRNAARIPLSEVQGSPRTGTDRFWAKDSMAAGTPKVSNPGRNGYLERDARRSLNTKTQQSKAASDRAKKDQDRAGKEADKAASAEWRKHGDSNYRPEATLESLMRGNQRRGRNYAITRFDLTSN
ncbi:hypothetical protein AC579_7258 [Pseudocercospora musae]|uniref:Uncharacterized protein n=1 Tax=Pseudocercospora musae TaxID=113226 RepID=A0A139I9P0_9PEZI|nr:hypothetical protein AC579_7258 [Pseudocercospora musae]